MTRPFERITKAIADADDGYGESLTTITQIGHVARFGIEEFAGRIVAIGLNQAVEMFLYSIEMRLAIPKRVVGIEGYHSKIL